MSDYEPDLSPWQEWLVVIALMPFIVLIVLLLILPGLILMSYEELKND